MVVPVELKSVGSWEVNGADDGVRVVVPAPLLLETPSNAEACVWKKYFYRLKNKIRNIIKFPDPHLMGQIAEEALLLGEARLGLG